MAWPTADELARVHRASGELLEHVELLAGRLRPVYMGNYPDDATTFAELGALTGFVSSMKCDLALIGESMESLARVRDAACPA